MILLPSLIFAANSLIASEDVTAFGIRPRDGAPRLEMRTATRGESDLMMESGVGMLTKVEAVRTVFEEPEWYFSRRAYDIRIRTETVRQMASLGDGAQVLDIGCGDGSVSLPLLTPKTRVTMLDLSSSMLSLARSKVPPELLGNVEIINDDFANVAFAPQSFDLILCIGLLASVPFRSNREDGRFTEAKRKHHCGVQRRESFCQQALCPDVWSQELVQAAEYHLNAVSYVEVPDMLQACGFYPQATYRYTTPPPGVNRLFSQDTLYKLNRGLFGQMGANRNAWLGNEHISLFSRGSRRP